MFEIAAKEDQKMQVRRSFMLIGILSLTVLLLTTVALVQRQLAQQKKSENEAAAATNERPVTQSSLAQSRRMNSDGLEFERTLVRGVPFSAKQIIEVSETLADGNTSTESSTSSIYRDSRGRTRRDLLAAEAGSTGETTTTTSIINDPLTGFTYTLDPRTNVARRTIFVAQRGNSPNDLSVAATRGTASREQVLPVPSVSGNATGLRAGTEKGSSQATPEPLGTREIEGVLAEGTRISMTVPKGAMGNEQPFEVVVERWYSSDLRAIVLVKRTGLNGGTTTYRLTDIKRAEPAAALFIVPRDYKIRDEAGREVPIV